MKKTERKQIIGDSNRIASLEISTARDYKAHIGYVHLGSTVPPGGPGNPEEVDVKIDPFFKKRYVLTEILAKNGVVKIKYCLRK